MNWVLPEVDGYFTEGHKKDGFQSEHLLRAFEYVNKFRVAVDVGAHVGFWAKLMAEKFETVYCFEPAQDTFACLEKNVGMLGNVRLYNLALGALDGSCEVCQDVNRKGNTGSRFVSLGKGRTKVITLDSMPLEHLDLLKIDVEGFEYPVLQGAKMQIQAFKPVVIMEYKNFARRYAWSPKSAENYLLKQGYKLVEYLKPDKIYVPV